MISIFTPTYNRANTIHRVWESLNSQTYRDFEWIVVDDGSNDNIIEVIEDYKKKADFKIHFHKFEQNKGKHFATNKGISMASGEFFIIADSDDAFIPEALEIFMRTWNDIPFELKNQFCGVRASCKDQNGKRFSNEIGSKPIDANMIDSFYKYKIKNETWAMTLTHLHRENLFEEKYLGYNYPEGEVWQKISKVRKFRFIQDELRIYYIDELNNSLSSKSSNSDKKIIKNLVGGRRILNNELGYFFYDVKYFIKAIAAYATYSWFDLNIFNEIKLLKSIRAKGFYCLMAILVLPLFIYKRYFECVRILS